MVDPPATPALRTRSKTVGFQILAGDTEAMLDGLIAGATGVVPGFAACAPQACYEVFAAWKDGDRPLAEEKQARLIDAARLRRIAWPRRPEVCVRPEWVLRRRATPAATAAHR